MQMIRAIIRPEKVDGVVDSLDNGGFCAFTKIDVFGRGRQKGIQIGPTIYDELAKVMLLIAASDEDTDEILRIIEDSARTGSFGDGKIFISPIEEAYTIRTGERGL
ncbi:MAG: putative nitrogen regulatory PII-like protein [Candidatus Methanogasteraceae archaeon]|nr:MAG: putative nitrogen regulatory PII-like protein [ANME-2 cluster archaeon]